MILRIILFVSSVISFWFVMQQIRKLRLQVEDAVFWILFMLVLFGVSVFPSPIIALSGFLRIESPANFVFLSVIFVLILKIFFMSIHISKIDNQIKELVQRIALEKKKENV